ncbi:uncharacterized protein Dwil_GK27724, partial [Drosophila willistoni]
MTNRNQFQTLVPVQRITMGKHGNFQEEKQRQQRPQNANPNPNPTPTPTTTT